MIAISSKSQSFSAIAKYLVAGRSGEEWDRVSWTASRNLPTADPELAGKIMRATAEQSDRVARPVYHLALSFDPHDQVDRAAIERVADRVLQRLGLEEYQVVMVAHRDREHQHVHLLINRVHPETGRSWDRSYDYRVIQQVLREEERALGLREVPGRLAQSPEQDVRARVERLSREYGRESDASVSTVALRRELEGYEQVIVLGLARVEAETAVQAARARLDQLSVAIERAERTSAAFDRALARAHRDPAEARLAFNRMVEERDIAQAVQALGAAPERFGALRTVVHSRLAGLLATHDDTESRRAARVAAEQGREAFNSDQAARRIAAESRERRIDEVITGQFALTYSDPETARARLMQITAEHGVAHAAQILVERPEELGPLWATADGRDDTAARAHARLVVEAISGRDAVIAPATEQAAARLAVEHTHAHAEAMRADERRQPRRAEVERRVAYAMRLLAPHELERLHTVLTAPQRALVQRLKATVRDVMLGRDEGQQQ